MDLQTRILIVDDDEGIRSLISEFLAKHGYETAVAADPPAMRELLGREHFDLIVLDVMMPREDGLTALRQLGPGAPPVIMLSAVGTDVDRIVGLEMGADDYLAKPCNPRELLARIRTVLRRRGGTAKAEGEGEQPASPTGGIAQFDSGEGLRFAGWRMDLGLRLLFDPANRLITLSDGEFRLLRAFAEHPRRVLTRDQLLDWSRGEDSEHYDRAIDVQLSRLRRKLAEGDGGQDIIRTVRNEGYLFVPSVTAEQSAN
ncbi:two-component system, OmpR family, response regulator [Novosphingobium sp. CF614]|uniref:response regulator n=1 Tax=Novosphingobium sp. CF614 TaxID=1884364 RepID=UPI0008E5B419|nr:response regulator [Novosphingobium sp. CF614]SFF90318.1 two-component system, OmpR family, response regulator [Novosphingobium sp. CF614]